MDTASSLGCAGVRFQIFRQLPSLMILPKFWGRTSLYGGQKPGQGTPRGKSSRSELSGHRLCEPTIKKVKNKGLLV